LQDIHRFLQENTGNRWNMKAVFRPEIVEIFSGGFLPTSSAFRQEPARNHRKKIRKLSGRNTASIKSLELPGTGRFRVGLGCKHEKKHNPLKIELIIARDIFSLCIFLYFTRIKKR